MVETSRGSTIVDQLLDDRADRRYVDKETEWGGVSKDVEQADQQRERKRKREMREERRMIE